MRNENFTCSDDEATEEELDASRIGGEGEGEGDKEAEEAERKEEKDGDGEKEEAEYEEETDNQDDYLSEGDKILAKDLIELKKKYRGGE